MSIEALKLALEAHKKNERHQTVAETRYWCQQYKLLAEQFIQAIEQAEQAQPVAYGMPDTQIGRNHRMMMVRLDKGQDGCTVPLYTAPPPRQPWVGLTDEEIDDFAEYHGLDFAVYHPFARAVEAKLKEST